MLVVRGMVVGIVAWIIATAIMETEVIGGRGHGVRTRGLVVRMLRVVSVVVLTV